MFTDGNDINILQSSDTQIISAGPGDDTYIVSPVTLTAGQEVTVSDAAGTNTLQLISGLTIASSMVVSNALQLTLSNGAIINVLDADTFNFNVGGNVVTNDAGVDKNFSTFAQENLGVTVPAEGEAPVAGGHVVISDVTTPVLSISDATVAEDDGTPPTFTVTLSDAPGAGEEVTVDYATADGTAEAGTDYTAKTGTLTFAEDETTKEITVAITDDAEGEPDETFTVILSNVTGTIGEDAATIIDAEATGTITNDDTSDISIDTAEFPTMIDLDAGGGAYNFTDDAAVSNYASIENFGPDDTISFVNADVNHYSFSNDGTDVDITYNNNEGDNEAVVNHIVLVGVVQATDLVYDQSSFVSAIGFDPFV